MKWKTAKLPDIGDTRERLKFSWFPIKCEDGITRWLETVRVLEIYTYRWMDWDTWKMVKAYPAEFEKEKS